MDDKNNKFFRGLKLINKGFSKGVNKTLNGIEWLGNKFPKPFFLFIYLTLGLIIISLILYYVLPNGVNLYAKTDKEENVKVFNLIGRDGIIWWLKNFISNFMALATTGIVLLTTIFVTVAERSGFIDISLRKVALALPKKILTPTVIFLGCVSSLAADAGYLILIPLAGTLYYRVGRHPLAGIAAVFAGVSGGFATSLIPGSVEFLMTSLTNKILGEEFANIHITSLSTYYFTLVLLFVYTLIAWFITDVFVEKRLISKYKVVKADDIEVGQKLKLTPIQKKAMWFVLGFTMIYIIGSMLMIFIPNAPFNALINKNFTTGIYELKEYSIINHLALIIGILFLGIGIIFGFVSKSFTKRQDILDALMEGFKRTIPALLLFLVMSQFISALDQSKIGKILGYYIGIGINFDNAVLTIFLFIFIVSIINLFIGSLSAKWAILGPIFLIALKDANIHPSTAVAAYRVGDSATNMISPLMPYFPLIILWAKDWIVKEEKEKFEIGSLMSIMFPYSISFLFAGTAILLVWIAIGIPIGFDGPIYIDQTKQNLKMFFQTLKPKYTAVPKLILH